MLAQDVSISDRWYVTNGVVAVGPLGFELLTRGVARGRIPNGSLVRHESWKVWRPLDDVSALTHAARNEAVTRFADLSAGVEERASSPNSTPPPPPERLSGLDLTSGGPPSRSSVRPPAVDPVGVLGQAQTLEDAFLLTLSTAVTAAGATVGLLHRDRPEAGITVTEYANGPLAELLLGERVAQTDACLLAARAGVTVIAEPRLGDAGRYLASRISRCIDTPRGLAMVPVTLFDQLVAVLELGRESCSFRATEIARVENVAEALTERIVVAGWLD